MSAEFDVESRREAGYLCLRVRGERSIERYEALVARVQAEAKATGIRTILLDTREVYGPMQAVELTLAFNEIVLLLIEHRVRLALLLPPDAPALLAPLTVDLQIGHAFRPFPSEADAIAWLLGPAADSSEPDNPAGSVQAESGRAVPDGPYVTTVTADGDLVRITAKGRYAVQRTLALVRLIATECKRHSRAKALVNTAGVVGVMSRAELYDVGRAVAECLGNEVRVATVSNAERVADSDGYMAETATRMGANFRVFVTEIEALSWLRTGGR
jgi:hypothetical protein